MAQTPLLVHLVLYSTGKTVSTGCVAQITVGVHHIQVLFVATTVASTGWGCQFLRVMLLPSTMALRIIEIFTEPGGIGYYFAVCVITVVVPVRFT
jgi:hypothetical protein